MLCLQYSWYTIPSLGGLQWMWALPGNPSRSGLLCPLQFAQSATLGGWFRFLGGLPHSIVWHWIHVLCITASVWHLHTHTSTRQVKSYWVHSFCITASVWHLHTRTPACQVVLGPCSWHHGPCLASAHTYTHQAHQVILGPCSLHQSRHLTSAHTYTHQACQVILGLCFLHHCQCLTYAQADQVILGPCFLHHWQCLTSDTYSYGNLDTRVHSAFLLTGHPKQHQKTKWDQSKTINTKCWTETCPKTTMPVNSKSNPWRAGCALGNTRCNIRNHGVLVTLTGIHITK